MRNVFVIGDSIAAPRGISEEPMHGWASYLSDFLTDEYEVLNFARSEMTSRKYFTERFHLLLERLMPGDIVLIALGTVDAMIHDASRFVPVPEFKMWLHSFIRYIKAADADVVLTTPVQRHTFDIEKNVTNSRGIHATAIRSVAAEAKVPLLDIELETTNIMNEVGPKASKELFCWFEPGQNSHKPSGVWDATHLNKFGARLIGSLVCRQLSILGLISNLECLQASEEHYSDAMSHLLYIRDTISDIDLLSYEEQLEGVLKVDDPNSLIGPFGKVSGIIEGLDRSVEIFAICDGIIVGSTFSMLAREWTIRPLVAWRSGAQLVEFIATSNDGIVGKTRLEINSVTVPSEPIITFPRKKFMQQRPEIKGRCTSTANKVVIWCNQVIVGAVAPKDNGEFHFVAPHSWKPGSYEFEVSVVFGAMESARVGRELEIIGASSDYSTFDPNSFISYAEKCEHRPFSNFGFASNP